MTKADNFLIETIKEILANGYKDENPRPKYADGTPAYTYSINHVTRQYDLSAGEFPICTLRPIAWKTGIREIFTIYQKPTNKISEMEEMGVSWWRDWDIGDGTIGQRYGGTVKRYDLINQLIHDIENDPYGRRKIVNLWQETDLHETPGLAPCAFLTIWNVRGEYLDMCMIQRSGDMLTASGGGMVNEVQYAALLMMIAQHTGYKAGVFTHFVANEQIYDRHMDAANELIKRYESNSPIIYPPRTVFHFPPKPLSEIISIEQKEFEEENPHLFIRPQLVLNPEATNFFEMTIDDFEMKHYNPMKPQLRLELGI